MLRRISRASDVFNQIPGRAYLLLSVLIFAADNSVMRKLTDLGEQNLIDGRNPISWCNILFVGNLCALVALLLLYGKHLKRSDASEASLVNSFSPSAGILAAYLILSEAPTIDPYIGDSVIIFGIVLNQIGIIGENAERSAPFRLFPAKEMDVNVGFKGI
jgi:drug/metabolite transporter (DMT)-like permease